MKKPSWAVEQRIISEQTGVYERFPVGMFPRETARNAQEVSPGRKSSPAGNSARREEHDGSYSIPPGFLGRQPLRPGTAKPAPAEQGKAEKEHEVVCPN